MAGLMLVNPRKRRKTSIKRRKVHHKRRTPLAHAHKKVHRKKYRRNPIGGSMGIMSQVTGAAIGAAGAVAVDIVMGKISKNLPLSMQVAGAGRSAVQGVVSIGLGMFIAKVLKKKTLGVHVATGGLTVALHGVMSDMLAKNVPSLAGVHDLSGDLLGMGDGNLLGIQNTGMGWFNAAPVSYGFG